MVQVSSTSPLQCAREQMKFHFRFSGKDFESNFHLFANKLQRNSEKQPHLTRNRLNFHLFAKLQEKTQDFHLFEFPFVRERTVPSVARQQSCIQYTIAPEGLGRVELTLVRRFGLRNRYQGM